MKKKSVRLKYKDSVHAESVFFSTTITCWLPFSNFLTNLLYLHVLCTQTGVVYPVLYCYVTCSIHRLLCKVNGFVLSQYVVQRVRSSVSHRVSRADCYIDLDRHRQRPRCSARTSLQAQSLGALLPSQRLRASLLRHNPKRHNSSHLHRYLDRPLAAPSHGRLRRRCSLVNLPRATPCNQVGLRSLGSRLVLPPVPLSSNNQRRRSLANLLPILLSHQVGRRSLGSRLVPPQAQLSQRAGRRFLVNLLVPPPVLLNSNNRRRQSLGSL